MATNPLLQLQQLGQSLWLDSIRRSYILSGGLAQLIEADGISGETSNPTIFEKAIVGSQDYAADIAALTHSGKSFSEIYDRLSTDDVRMAADAFRPVYDRTQGLDGYISLEVSPKLAHDAKGTVAEAQRLVQVIGRPNVMIKIPATPEGMAAVEACIAAGINVNATLLFALDSYEQVAWSYVAGLARRAREGKPVTGIASVASFFVSRIDTLADNLLEDCALAASNPEHQKQMRGLKGKLAIASAKLAYHKFGEIFGGQEFQALKAQGARVQRPLWASTSTKNPAYRDVIYVEELIGPDTVNTLPAETVNAFRDHGCVNRTLDANVDEARRTVDQFHRAGLSLQAVTTNLLEDGLDKFEKSYDSLLANLEAKQKALMA